MRESSRNPRGNVAYFLSLAPTHYYLSAAYKRSLSHLSFHIGPRRTRGPPGLADGFNLDYLELATLGVILDAGFMLIVYRRVYGYTHTEVNTHTTGIMNKEQLLQ